MTRRKGSPMKTEKEVPKGGKQYTQCSRSKGKLRVHVYTFKEIKELEE